MYILTFKLVSTTDNDDGLKMSTTSAGSCIATLTMIPVGMSF